MADPDRRGPGGLLSVRQVSVRFGGLQALESVDLEVASGELHGLIGPNGAGKTTLFNVITGLRAPSHGQVALDGRDITRARPHVRARLGLARTFQRLELFGTLTARENVQMAAEVQRGKLAPGRSPAAQAEAQLERVGILGIADEPTDALPTGLARLVELARALATSPRALLLDEPSSGLNAEETTGLGRALRRLAAEGMAVLLVEHDMSLVMSVCARVDVLDNGGVIASGGPAEVRADPAVQEAYLGGDKAPEANKEQADGKVAVDADGEVAVAIDGGTGSNGRPDGAPAGRVSLADPVAPPPVAVPGPGNGSVPGAAGTVRAVSVHDVRAAYGRIEVLHGVSLEVPRGSALALLGPNGAGKTTLLKVISGQMAPTRGSVWVQGRQLGRRGASGSLARAGLCMIPEGRSIFPNLSVAENLVMYTFRRSGLKPSDVEARAFERFPVLGRRRKQVAGTLSGGEQRMLAMARALTTDPEILLTDELSMGLAPLIVEELYEVVAQLVASENLTIVMVEQFVKTALAIADQAVIMVNGELVQQGRPDEIRDEVVGAYLGSDAD